MSVPSGCLWVLCVHIFSGCLWVLCVHICSGCLWLSGVRLDRVRGGRQKYKRNPDQTTLVPIVSVAKKTCIDCEYFLPVWTTCTHTPLNKTLRVVLVPPQKLVTNMPEAVQCCQLFSADTVITVHTRDTCYMQTYQPRVISSFT